MKLPVLNVISKQVKGVTDFTGLDHHPKVRPTAFYDMRNMSGDKLPVMATRKKRRYLRTLNAPNGLLAHDSLCWVDGTGFFVGGKQVGEVADTDKRMVRMGAYVLIWPDAVYYNTQTQEFGKLGAVVSCPEVTAHLCRADGTEYGEYSVGTEAPESPENGQLWVDTSVTPQVLRYYSTTKGMWESMPTVYTKISGDGIGKPFEQFDGVEISGMELDGLNGSFYLVDRGDDWIIVTALITQAHTQETTVTVERKIPKMDYVCELDNRIWGCSSEKHEIYASALGDPKNWSQYIGQATDSYAVTVGSGGDFTGCAAHMGSVWFFKEDTIHQILGYKPATYQLDTMQSRGVQKGSERSLQTVNETLLYKGRNDVCRMGSALPSPISDALGEEAYANAVAGADGKRYYICMRDREGCPHLLVHDTETGAWVKEDELDVKWFASLNGELYMLCANGQLWSANGGGDVYAAEDAHEEDAFEWMLDTGDLGIDEPHSRYLSRIQMYCRCELGTRVIVEVRWDNQQNWREIFRVEKIQHQSIVVPYVPPRCRTIRIRIRGTGSFELYQIVKHMEQGSDVYGIR